MRNPEYNEGGRSQEMGHYKASIVAYQNSINLDPAFAWAPNNLAWLYATCVEAQVRSGSKAIQYATIACKISEWHCWSFIDTLAAGYAEAGDFDNAVKHAERAKILAPKDNQGEVQERLKRFRAGKPLHLDN
jgi:tetratricopeptide (TPR) repeat protein